MIAASMSGVDAADTDVDPDVAAQWNTCACSGGSPIARWRCTARRSGDCRAVPPRRGCRCARCSRTTCGGGLRNCMRRACASRSIAIVLSAWRGLYRWLGREGRVSLNPVEGVRAPKAPRPLAKGTLGRSVGAARELSRRRRRRRCGARCARPLHRRAALRLRVAHRRARGARRERECASALLDRCRRRRSAGDRQRQQATQRAGRASRRCVGAAMAGAARHACQTRRAALFVSRRGTRLTASQVRSRLNTRALKAGLPTHVHPHMLRHSFASHVLQSSGDLRAVQELLGHANITTTQVYTKLDFQHLAHVYDAAHPRAKKRGGSVWWFDVCFASSGVRAATVRRRLCACG